MSHNHPGGTKKALLLFAKKSVDDGRAHPEQLVALLQDANEALEVAAAFFEDLLFFMNEDAVEVVNTANGRHLADYDAVYFRYWSDAQGPALAAARFCQLKHIPFVDREVLRPGSFNKITQYMNLYEAGVPFPRTLVAPARELLARYKKYGFTFPMVLKSAASTRGQDNYKVQTESEMRRILERDAHLTFVLQPFLPNVCDYRVLVMGEQVVLIIKRTARPGVHLNNTSQGGSAELVKVEELPEEVRNLSLHAAAFFGRQVAGVDMMRCTSDGRWYCLEVNRSPQIEHASFAEEKAALLGAYLQEIAK